MSSYSLTRFTSPNAGVAVSTAGNDLSTTAALGQAVQNMDQNAIKDPGGSDGQILERSGGTWVAAASTINACKELGAASVTSGQTVTSTASPGTDVTSMTLTVTPDGTHPVYVDVLEPQINGSAATSMNFALQKDGSIVQTVNPNSAGNLDPIFTMTFRHRDSAPTNASHTYKESAWSGAANTITFSRSITSYGLITAIQVQT